MKQKILYLFTQTPMHIGDDNSVGPIDKPVVRECHTGFVIINGSAIKGCLADNYCERDNGRPVFEPGNQAKGIAKRTDSGRSIFGYEGLESDKASAGGVSFGEGSLLAFPVRSLKGCFAWLTSPLALLRWARANAFEIADDDAASAKPNGNTLPQLPIVTEDEIVASDDICDGNEAVLEDYCLTRRGNAQLDSRWIAKLKAVHQDVVWKTMCANQLALVSNATLSLFSRSACEIANHVRINDETGAAADKALFDQENVPAETMFYAVLKDNSRQTLDQLKVPSVVQIGGNRTTGLGFCSTQLS